MDDADSYDADDVDAIVNVFDDDVVYNDGDGADDNVVVYDDYVYNS